MSNNIIDYRILTITGDFFEFVGFEIFEEDEDIIQTNEKIKFDFDEYRYFQKDDEKIIEFQSEYIATCDRC